MIVDELVRWREEDSNRYQVSYYYGRLKVQGWNEEMSEGGGGDEEGWMDPVSKIEEIRGKR